MNTSKFPPRKNKPFSRRKFLKGASALATISIVPSHVLGLRGAESPNNKLNIACIGAGGRGAADLDGVQSENIVALCDVDQERAADSYRKFPQAKRFTDFRKMLDALDREIDAVVVATPDHTHAVATMRAIKMKKPVYCEKPLTHTLHEARAITEAAREYQVATQLGNQGHSDEHIRMFCEWIWDGAIGTVREVHAFCASNYMPRNRVRPEETPPVPPTLDWEQWLGPAPYRPYHSTYVPGTWRGWVPFGGGVVADWACHVLDPVFWALDLGAPTSVRAEAIDYDDPKIRAETFPPGSKIYYEFPERNNRPPVRVIWFDGEAKPPRPDELEPGRNMVDTGAIVIGDKGKIMYGSHGAGGVRIIPESQMKAYTLPPKTLPRSKGHYRDWIDACKGGAPASSNFDYGGPLTEVALLGVLALRMNGEKLLWDAKAMKVTNNEEANQYINPPYREGWKL